MTGTLLSRLIRNYGLAALWGFLVLMMARDYFVIDPPDASLAGTDLYGHNSKGHFTRFALFSLIELALFYAILRPWSFRRSVGRAAVALLLAVVWLGIGFIAVFHTGGVAAFHLMWVIFLNVLAVVLIVGSGISLILQRSHPKTGT